MSHWRPTWGARIRPIIIIKLANMETNNQLTNNVTMRKTQAKNSNDDSGVNSDNNTSNKPTDSNALCDMLQNVFSEIKSMKEQNKMEFKKIETRQNQYLKVAESNITLLETKLNKQIAEVQTTIAQIATKNNDELSALKEKINNIETNLTGSSINIEQPQINTYAENLSIRIEISTFSGKMSENPILFLNKLQQYLEINKVREHMKLFVLNNALIDDAKLWWELINTNSITFEQFTHEFKIKFWSENRQRKLLDKLRFGKYEPTGSLGREMYTLQLYSFTKYLNPPLSDKDILGYLKYHFDENIGIAIINRGIETVSEFIALLREHDEYNNGMKASRRFERREEGRNNKGQNVNTNSRSNDNNPNQNTRSFNARSSSVHSSSINQTHEQVNQEGIIRSENL